MLIGGKLNAVLATLRTFSHERPRLRLRGLAGGKPRLGGFRFGIENSGLDLELVVFRAQVEGGFWRVLAQSGALSSAERTFTTDRWIGGKARTI
jgi:hypothetical protein